MCGKQLSPGWAGIVKRGHMHPPTPPPPHPGISQKDIEDVDDAERALTLSNPLLQDLEKVGWRAGRHPLRGGRGAGRGAQPTTAARAVPANLGRLGVLGLHLSGTLCSQRLLAGAPAAHHTATNGPSNPHCRRRHP